MREKTSSVTEDAWLVIGCFCPFAHCRKTVKIRLWELSVRCEKTSSVTEDVWAAIGCFCRFAHFPKKKNNKNRVPNLGHDLKGKFIMFDEENERN